MREAEFTDMLMKIMDNRHNPYHPFVFIHGEPKIGKNVYIGLFSEINAKYSEVIIGDCCDIASFSAINVSDSHRLCIGISADMEKAPIIIENNVFVGSHTFIKGGAHIGHHTVVAAGTIVEGVEIPPYSLVVGNRMKIKEGYYRKHIGRNA